MLLGGVGGVRGGPGRAEEGIYSLGCRAAPAHRGTPAIRRDRPSQGSQRGRGLPRARGGEFGGCRGGSPHPGTPSCSPGDRHCAHGTTPPRPTALSPWCPPCQKVLVALVLLGGRGGRGGPSPPWGRIRQQPPGTGRGARVSAALGVGGGELGTPHHHHPLSLSSPEVPPRRGGRGGRSCLGNPGGERGKGGGSGAGETCEQGWGERCVPKVGGGDGVGDKWRGQESGWSMGGSMGGGHGCTYNFSSLPGVSGEPVLAGGALWGEEQGVSGAGGHSWGGWGWGGAPRYLRGVLWVLGSRWAPVVLAGPGGGRAGWLWWVGDITN